MRIILEERKFIWSDEEIKEFKRYWEQNEPLPVIAKHLDCSVTDIALLIIDLAESGKIEARKSKKRMIKF